MPTHWAAKKCVTDLTEITLNYQRAANTDRWPRGLHVLRACTTVITAILLASCAKSVQVTSDFPTPLMEPYPLVVGVRYPASLTEFIHTEESSNEPAITIDLGTANVSMFRTLFSGMFAETIELDNEQNTPAPASVNLIIEPTLTDLEIASPGKSGTDQYTVWLNYNLRLSQPDGSLLGDWKITAYGQRDQGSMGMGGEDAINGATVVALRDAAASIVSEFSTAPGIASVLPAASVAAPPTTAQPAPVAEPATDNDDTGNADSNIE